MSYEKIMLLITFIFIVEIVFFVLYFLYWFITQLFSFFYRKQFQKKYNIKLSFRFFVWNNGRVYDENSFQLVYPYWFYANKNGSRNRVRKNNYLVWPKSYLWFDRYLITAKNPVLIVSLVKALRDGFGEDIIKRCPEEKEKYKDVQQKKKFLQNTKEVTGILDRFPDHPQDFENFCAELFQKMGYKVFVTAKVKDGGYDLILYKDGIKTIVECKRFSLSHTVGRPLIQKLVGANFEAKAQKMIFVTTSKFSNDAILYARDAGVTLVNDELLMKWVHQYFSKEVHQNILRREWELTKEDLKKRYPPDVRV